MKKLNICFFLISDGWGGAENVVYNLAKNMEKQGHNISIILNEETYSYFVDLYNVKLYNVGPIFKINRILLENFNLLLPVSIANIKIIYLILKKFFRSYIIQLNFKKIRKKILNLIEKINPNIIHFNNPIVLEFCNNFLSKINYHTIYTSHGLDFETHLNPISISNKRRKKNILNHFNIITSVSRFNKNYLISNGIISDIIIIYNGIDIGIINNLLNNLMIET